MQKVARIGAVLIAVAMLGLLVLKPILGDKEVKKGGQVVQKKDCLIRLSSARFTQGTQVEIDVLNRKETAIEKTNWSIDGDAVSNPNESLAQLSLGEHEISLNLLYSDQSTCESKSRVEILSDIKPTISTYEIVASYNHDPTAYTQGLFWSNDKVYEGTGQYGESVIRNYALSAPLESLQQIELPIDLFGEGICFLGEELYQLTYKSGKGIIYDRKSLEKQGEFQLPSAEGWGLTSNGESLILSDGSNTLYFINPETFDTERKIKVYDNQEAIKAINELEYVDGKIYANLYGANILAVINPENGKVLEYVDCRGIQKEEEISANQDVLNGIAYRPETNTYLLTGKYWKKIYEIRILPRMAS